MNNSLINIDYTYAVIGASENPEKYGHIVLKDLLLAGFKVIPINPHSAEILGLATYKRISDVPEKVDVAIMIVPPAVSESVLLEIKAAGVLKVWFQPGSESEAAIEYCRDNEIQYQSGACIMIERKK